jgi:hypothetical protein
LPIGFWSEYATYIKGKTDVLFSDEEVGQLVEALQTGRLPTGFFKGLETRRHNTWTRSRNATRARPAARSAGPTWWSAW